MSRDWQKDMKSLSSVRELYQMMNIETIEVNVAIHWLQQYAHEANEVCYWKGEAKTEKERADKAEKKVNRLRQALEEALKREDAYEAQEIMLYILVSFFPDKEGAVFKGE